MRTREDELRRLTEEHGQEHLFEFSGGLEGPARERFLDQLEGIDFALVSELRRRIRQVEPELPHTFEPPEVFPLARGPEEQRRADQARRRGEELLGEGRIGYLLVAGGQASRLGSDSPKGCHPVGPVSGRSLFEWHAHRLLAVHRRHGAPTPFYVMTSAANDAATRAFFEQHAFFGLDPQDVRFFSQAMLPALDLEGRILLRAPGEVFLAPNGHGGVLSAFRASGCLADARARGLTTLSYFQVDNPLARPTDPFFLGLHDLEQAEMSSKVVSKRDAHEKVGVLGRIDGRLGCIEYSDLPEGLREARDGEGLLVFRAGNIAVHALALEFLDRITSGALSLPWHVARKSLDVVRADGERVRREGVKFETFVFDALGLAERTLTVEVERALEFSPLKNAEGPDSPQSVRRDLCRLFEAWLRAVDADLGEPDAEGLHAIEVDPLVAEDEEEFRRAQPREPRRLPGGLCYEELPP